MADILKPDLCVIGAGALGTSLAIMARQAGLETVLICRPTDAENDPAGGNLRRAALLASAGRAQAMRNAGTVGLANVEPKPSFRALSEHSAAVAEGVAARDSEDRLKALGITLVDGEVAFAQRHTIKAGDQMIRARHFALATGSRPSIPALPGLDQVTYFTPDTIGDNLRKLSHLVVIGGTPVALELGQAYRRLGSMVTLVPQGGLLPGFDPELVAVLVRQLRSEGLVILDDAEVSAIQPRGQGTGVKLQRSEREESLDVSHILLAMGREPDLDAALLEQARLRRDAAQRLVLRPGGQTTNRRITAIGGASGEEDTAIALRQARLLVDRLSGRSAGRFDPAHLPRLVQTEPPLAEMGPLAAAVTRVGQTVLRSNLSESDANRAGGHGTGVAKLIAERDGTIAAAGILGAGAGEMIAVLALARMQGLKLGDLSHLVLPPLSAAAALHDLAEQYQVASAKLKSRLRLPGAR